MTSGEGSGRNRAALSSRSQPTHNSMISAQSRRRTPGSFSGTYAGQTLTEANIRADFPKAELRAWSGIDIGAPVAPATRSSMTAATTAVYTFRYVKVHHSLRLRMVDVLKRGALYPESVKITTGRHAATTASVR